MDPIKKSHTENFDIRSNEKVDEEIRHSFINQRLMDLISYIRAVLKNIVYTVRPRLNPEYLYKLGEDVVLVKPSESDNDNLNKDMLKFFYKVNFLFSNHKQDKIVDIFIKGVQKDSLGFLENIKLINNLIEDGNISNITQDELNVLSKFQDIANIQEIDNLSLREVKTFYNLFMKCMDYAIKNDPKKAVQIAELEGLFVDKSKSFRAVSDNDRNLLQGNLDFVLLLQELEANMLNAEYLKKYKQTSIHMAIHNILHDKKGQGILSYDNLASLQETSGRIKRILLEQATGKLTQLEYDVAMLNEANSMGLVPRVLFDEMQRFSNKRYFSERHFREILLQHGFDSKMDKIKAYIKSFPDIVDEALEKFNLESSLSHEINMHRT